MWSKTNGCRSKCSFNAESNTKDIVVKNDSELEKNIAFAAGLLVGAGYTVQKQSNVNGISPQPYYLSPFATNHIMDPRIARLPSEDASTVSINVLNNTGQTVNITSSADDYVVDQGATMTIQVPLTSTLYFYFPTSGIYSAVYYQVNEQKNITLNVNDAGEIVVSQDNTGKQSNVNGISPQPYYLSPFATNRIMDAASTVSINVLNNTGQTVNMLSSGTDDLYVVDQGATTTIQVPLNSTLSVYFPPLNMYGIIVYYQVNEQKNITLNVNNAGEIVVSQDNTGKK